MPKSSGLPNISAVRNFAACLAVVATTVAAVFPATAIAKEKDGGARYKVGVERRKFIPQEPYNWRGAQTHALMATIWYPADTGAEEQTQWIGPPEAPLFSGGKAVPAAKVAASISRFPLIVLSHGTGGSALIMGWMAAGLAAHGYIVAAVDHPGNNATEPYTMQGFVLWWERARDLSVVIDKMLADPEFGDSIDPKRIGAAGFSLGGYTMIEIAGGITQRSLYADFCHSPQADGICKDPPEFPGLTAQFNDAEKTAAGSNDKEMLASLQHASDSYRDPRIRAVFAMAPALGPAFEPASLEKISIPVAIVAGEADTNVPIASSAKFFARHIPHAKLTLIPGAGHYVFLGTCTETGKKAQPGLCDDGPSANREAVHAEAVRMAADFFATHLK